MLSRFTYSLHHIFSLKHSDYAVFHVRSYRCVAVTAGVSQAVVYFFPSTPNARRSELLVLRVGY